MRVKVEERGESVHVELVGDIHIEHGDELLEVFNAVAGKSPKEVVIDISGLKTITSSGIGKIVMLYRELQKHKGRIRITGANDTVFQILRIVKLDKLVEIEGLQRPGQG